MSDPRHFGTGKDKPITIMEVCGTHTMAIARGGIRQLLPENVRLLSGPGCPVCVTPPEMIDVMLELAGGKMTDSPIIAVYGDMLRVPGTVSTDSLFSRRAEGADIRIVYSPMDALKLAEENTDREVVFIGIGFETTAPGTAAAIKAAAQKNTANFSVFSMLKRLEPSVLALAASQDFNVDAFLCPGHVAVIIGEDGMKFFEEKLHVPAVISGFETRDILKSLSMILRQLKRGEAFLENEYSQAVRPEGNGLALEMINEVFEYRTDLWRGLGIIPESGLGIRKEYADFDAENKFSLNTGRIIESHALCGSKENGGCRCGDVICGRIMPGECPMFGTACLPETPKGPCMVSSEGSCAAAFRYGS